MVRLTFKKRAEKELNKLQDNEREKVVRKLREIVVEPMAGKRLKGEFAGFWSYRAWPYRIIYSFTNDVGVEIFSIEHRQSAYK